MAKLSRFLIYALIDPRYGSVRYIGRSSSGLTRPRQHWQPAKLKRESNPIKFNWLNKLLSLGLEPRIEIVATADTFDELIKLEPQYISMYKNNGKLLNILPGGIDTPDTSRPIIGYNCITGESIKYESLQAASADGFTPKKIAGCCKHKMDSHKLFFWRYQEDKTKLPLSVRKGKPITGTDIVSGETFFWWSTTVPGFNQSKISLACRNNKSYLGFIWKYADEQTVEEWRLKYKQVPIPKLEYKRANIAPYKKLKTKYGKIIATDCITNKYFLYNTIHDVVAAGFKMSDVLRVLAGKRSSCKGYRWEQYRGEIP